MKAKDDKVKRPGRFPGQAPKLKGNDEKENPSGYPKYPDNEDIYIQYHEESDINPEDPTKKKDLDVQDELSGEIGLNDLSGNDLDVPGGELDDDQEDIGSEDEENNYYSLSDDNGPEEETDDE